MLANLSILIVFSVRHECGRIYSELLSSRRGEGIANMSLKFFAVLLAHFNAGVCGTRDTQTRAAVSIGFASLRVSLAC